MSTADTVADQKVVTIHYTLTNDAGETLDSSEGNDPMAYLHGAHNIVPGLESELAGKSVGGRVEGGATMEHEQYDAGQKEGTFLQLRVQYEFVPCPTISTHSWYFDPKNQRFIYWVLGRAFGSDKGNRCVLPALHVFSTLVAACARSRGTASWRRQGMDHVGRTSGPENVDFSLVL